MDICSFWLDKLGMSTTPTLLLRMLVFALTALIGFCLSDKKRYYWGLAAICAVFFVCHAVSCMRAGYISPFADLTNYIRVIQIPIFALCLITFLRADTQSYHWVGVGFAVSFAIISAVVLLSVVTGTNPYTYVDDQMGILGWFSTTNSQASIVSMMTPILICMAYKSKRTWLFAATTVLACAQLYFLGTRLAYMAIFVSIFGTIFVAALCGEVKKLRYAAACRRCLRTGREAVADVSASADLFAVHGRKADRAQFHECRPRNDRHKRGSAKRRRRQCAAGTAAHNESDLLLLPLGFGAAVWR